MAAEAKERVDSPPLDIEDRIDPPPTKIEPIKIERTREDIETEYRETLEKIREDIKNLPERPDEKAIGDIGSQVKKIVMNEFDEVGEEIGILEDDFIHHRYETARLRLAYLSDLRDGDRYDAMWLGFDTLEEGQKAYRMAYDELASLVDEYDAWKAQRDGLEARLAGLREAPFIDLKTSLSTIRDMGFIEDAGMDVRWADPPDPESKREDTVKTMLLGAMHHLPSDWTMEAATSTPLRLDYSERGFYHTDSDGVSTISVGDPDHSISSKFMLPTSYHELGHRLVRALPEVKRLEREFYNRRTRDSEIRMMAYGELTRPNEFVDEYMGRIYKTDDFEVISMGIEWAYTDPEKLNQDPDLANFIYGILATTGYLER